MDFKDFYHIHGIQVLSSLFNRVTVPFLQEYPSGGRSEINTEYIMYGSLSLSYLLYNFISAAMLKLFPISEFLLGK